ncbi:phenylalanyl-tRNA synthetase beta subunit [Acetitomaculum ruminis DSM 5522]|uniref:Phenylalanine--tRNA ligase beta subunit n=1 Tax=Acetitomaculum ruminis DSM 5522 TaxID=1120918 RepID=A0A1I0V5Q9_9FIRM|nr:phenylalanine--tRNA ligase subunit beta [Acetitomaculum ruminis]SFA70886.1 phenylalanyl-tRNA synthetase beta subunit [Acetitomaculum ruminis DSM 5522]
MITSYKWIKDLVPGLEATPKDYVDAMTLSGSKVEGFKNLDEDLENIVIGKVLKIEKHPDADKLVICQVDIGKDEAIQIVTGAPNVVEGCIVPVVLDGGRVAGGHDGKITPGGVKIKKGKLRGVESNGMMCSIQELGSTTDMYPDACEDGLYILPEDAPIGDSAPKYLGLDDTIVEYEITSNRVDCFSVIGIAREAAATFNKELKAPVVKETGNSEDVNDYIKVQIQDKDLCRRYTARVVKNIKIAPSPVWMQRRLAAQGIRPINNIVDITNYVMEEFGQPMHAYDLNTIEDRQIIVKRAENGDTFTTLDGQERKLDDTVLMICDGKKPVGIAGIMGGENSMITDDVKEMLFEAACFDGTNIRLSSKKVGLRTDASSKFEKGLDPNLAILAINRACQLIEELGAGEVIGGVVDVYPDKKEGNRVKFDADKINKLLGTDISKETMLSYFDKLELGFDENTSEVIVPSWRQDLLCQADIAEEVARFFGYANIPSSIPGNSAMSEAVPLYQKVKKIAGKVARINGFSQGMTYSFESPKVFDKLLIPEDSDYRKAIVISNPLGEDFSIMRTISLNGMLNSLSLNYNRRNENVRLYELGNIYIADKLPLVKNLPDERMQFTLGMYGQGDFFVMKSVVEEFFHTLGLKKKTIYLPDADLPFLHPGRKAAIQYNGKNLGFIGEVHPKVLSNYEIKDRAYVAVIDLKTIEEFVDFDVKYVGVPKYPAVTRDISLVVPKEIYAGEIEDIIESKGGKMLESYALFDIYEGAQIKAGFKSLAYTLTFRSSENTLKDDDIAPAMKKIITSLEEKNIELRK